MIRVSCKIFLVTLGMWRALTCFIDFIAVPTAFKTISSRQEAGELGMIIFHTFNKVEILFSFILLGCGYSFRKWVVYKKSFFSSLGLLVILAFVYTFHMTPTIIESNKKKYELDESDPQYMVLDKTHQSYHSLFRKTDSVKILVLFTILISAIRRDEQECKV
jgi:hypothetical protein